LAKAGRANEWDHNNPPRIISTDLGRGGTSAAKVVETRNNKDELHAAKSLIEFTV